MNLILCGFKGCGKTHFGKRLATRLKIAFIDTDHLLEAQFQESCASLAKRLGREGFLAREAEIVASLHAVENAVIALGGGTLLHPESASLILMLGTMIYLQEKKERVKTRLLTPPLPTFINERDAEGSFEEMYKQRTPLYETLSTLQIHLDHHSEEEILASLEKIYQDRSHG